MKSQADIRAKRRDWREKFKELKQEFAKTCRDEEFTIKEIAEIMDISESSVRTVLK